MDFQDVIVAIVILAALFYVGQMAWRKTRAFSSKSSCGASCGCANRTKQRI